MDLAEFDYELPPELIAQSPPAERDGARMLVIDRQAGHWEDRMFRELPSFLRAGDCLVLNDSRVIPSRLYGHRPGLTARLQIFLVKPLSPDHHEWTALVRPGRKVRKGDLIEFEGGLQADVVSWGERGERTIRFRGEGDVLDAIERIGHVPLPPYIHRPDDALDRERYQTVVARERGSVAAPTAGLHFTPGTLEQVRSAGAEIARVTLHVGLGTFQPLEAEQIEHKRLHSETYSVAEEEWRRVSHAKRVVAVGTTSVRTLETVAETGCLQGETGIFIQPGYSFQVVQGMLTNFHLPRTSLLMLVSAFAGRELVMDAYRHAVQEKYRFFSYGDCMLIL